MLSTESRFSGSTLTAETELAPFCIIPGELDIMPLPLTNPAGGVDTIIEAGLSIPEGEFALVIIMGLISRFTIAGDALLLFRLAAAGLG